jgi:hypothetical protein
MREMLADRITFTPDRAARRYAFRIPGTLSRFFNGLVYPLGTAFPMPASWNQIATWLRQIDTLRHAARSLAGQSPKPYSSGMEVHVTPETAKKLKDLATTSGRAPEDIVEDALAGYLEEVASVRKTLDSRYDDLKSGRVKPIDGEEAFRKLREKSERRRSGG